jgi:hypothetical protein
VTTPLIYPRILADCARIFADFCVEIGINWIWIEAVHFSIHPRKNAFPHFLGGAAAQPPVSIDTPRGRQPRAIPPSNSNPRQSA